MVASSEPKGAHHPVTNGIEKHVRMNTLRIVDERTGDEYTLPINRNSINAIDFKQMKAPRDVENPCDQTEYGIRVYDPGYGNTAVSQSSITYKSVRLGSIHVISDIYPVMVLKEFSVIVAMILATWSPRRTLPTHSFCWSKVTCQTQKKSRNGNRI